MRGQGDLAALFTGADATFTALAELDAKIAAGVVPDPALEGEPTVDAAKGEPKGEATAEIEAPSRLRPAFVPTGSMVAALPTEALRVSEVELPSSVASFSLSPDGTRLVYITGDGGHSVHVLTLEGIRTTVADDPEARHADARFTADGSAVVFTSEYDGTDRTEVVGRWAAVERGS